MANAFKLYSQSGKFRLIDDPEFIEIAKDKITHDEYLKKRYFNKEINKLLALKIFSYLNIKVIPVDALLIQKGKSNNPSLKTIEMIEEDVEEFIFKEMKEDTNKFTAFLKGSKEALFKILEEDLEYKVLTEDITLNEFIEKNIYYTSNIKYKENKITIELTKDRFICDFNTQQIYKYKATILDPEGYQFNFRKNELFSSREEAILVSKQLVDEHYKLPIRNSKIQKIIVRTDSHNNLIVFWPELDTDDEYIMANDIIGTSDLAGDTKTSLLFFNECKDANPAQVKMVKEVIEKCMNLQTINVKHL